MKRIPIPLALLVLAALACNSLNLGGQTQTPVPGAISSPSQTRRLPPATATPSPTMVPPALLGTPYFQPGESISASNAAQVGALARWSNGTLTDLALSPDGRTVAAATTIGVALYDGGTLAQLDTWTTAESVETLAFTPDGGTLAVGFGSVVQLRDVASGAVRQELMNGETFYDSVNDLACSPDGKWLAVGTNTGVRIYDLPLGRPVAGLMAEEYLAYGVAFSPDSGMLASTEAHYLGGSGPILLWDTETWSLQERIEEEAHVESRGGITFTPDGKTLVFTGSWNYSILYDLESGTSRQAEAADFGTRYGVLAVSPDGATLAAGSYYGILSLWDTSNGGNRRDLQVDGMVLMGLVFSPDGKRLYAASEDGIRLWDLSTRSVAASAINHLPAGQLLSISPDGQRLAVLNGDEVLLLDARNGARLASYPAYDQAALSPDWKWLATKVSVDQVVLLYDLGSGAARRLADRGERQGVCEMTFSPDGRVLAQREDADEDSLLLWDTTSGSLLYALPGIFFLAFTPDSQGFAAVDAPSSEDTRDSLQFWDLAGGTQSGSLPLAEELVTAGVVDAAQNEIAIEALAFSPDGSRMAVNIASLVGVWERSGTLVWITEEHNYAPFIRLAFSPDGSVLAVGNELFDPLLLLDAETGGRLRVLPVQDSLLDGMAFFPDGTRVTSSGRYDGTLRFWGVRR